MQMPLRCIIRCIVKDAVGTCSLPAPLVKGVCTCLYMVQCTCRALLVVQAKKLLAQDRGVRCGAWAFRKAVCAQRTVCAN